MPPSLGRRYPCHLPNVFWCKKTLIRGGGHFFFKIPKIPPIPFWCKNSHLPPPKSVTGKRLKISGPSFFNASCLHIRPPFSIICFKYCKETLENRRCKILIYSIKCDYFINNIQEKSFRQMIYIRKLCFGHSKKHILGPFFLRLTGSFSTSL